MDSMSPETKRTLARPPFECIALTLQGGGALGAYQAGVYQALAEHHIEPDWIAGISIGTINAAIIAGNPPETRVAKLRRFWEEITSPSLMGAMSLFAAPAFEGDAGRALLDNASAAAALVGGVPGFFTPRIPSPLFQPWGTIAATSYYDTHPLMTTLKSLVDFERINSGAVRLSVGAVNVRSGNFVYFDTTTRKIGLAHIMASGALPPGFPAVEIEGEHYWDGGLVSNTPLQWVLQFGPRQDTLAFEVDLWSARGKFPRNMIEVATRQKDILYSSRTRDNTDRFADIQRARCALARLFEALPADLRDSPEARALQPYADHKIYSIVHLIYRAKEYEGDSKDYEFSRASMTRHWEQGYTDTIRTLRHGQVLERPANLEGLCVFDYTTGGAA